MAKSLQKQSISSHMHLAIAIATEGAVAGLHHQLVNWLTHKLMMLATFFMAIRMIHYCQFTGVEKVIHKQEGG